MSTISVTINRLFFSVIVLLSSVSVVLAQGADDYFNQGISAAAKGNDKTALKFFSKARKAGMKNPSVDYNQALSHYRLGQNKQARKLFIHLTNDKKYAQLAYLNLGLIANKQKDKKAAVKWFQKAYENNNNQKVTELAATALKRLDNNPKQKMRKKPNWKGFLSTSLANDSNVTLADDVNQPSASDNYLEIFAAGNNWLTGSRKDGIRLELSGILHNYSSETQYNYSQLNLGISKFKKIGQWRTRLKAGLSDIKVDGKGYEQIFSLMVNFRKRLENNYELRVRYRYSNIDTPNSAFSHLAGTRHQARIGINKRINKKRLSAYYQYELNDRKDLGSYATNNFTSYSPARHAFNLIGSFPLQDKWKVRLDGRYRLSDYANANSLASGATKKRSDTQNRVRAILQYNIEKDMELYLKYALTNNASNINSYDYDRTLTQVGVNWFF